MKHINEDEFLHLRLEFEVIADGIVGKRRGSPGDDDLDAIQVTEQFLALLKERVLEEEDEEYHSLRMAVKKLEEQVAQLESKGVPQISPGVFMKPEDWSGYSDPEAHEPLPVHYECAPGGGRILEVGGGWYFDPMGGVTLHGVFNSREEALDFAAKYGL